MSRHRSPAGRHAHPRPAPPTAAIPGAWPRPPDAPRRAALRPQPAVANRHTAPTAVRNGLAAAAATGGVLAVAVPVMALLPASDPVPAGAALALTSETGTDLPTRAASPVVAPISTGPDAFRTFSASVVPVLATADILPPEADAESLLKAVGLADLARQAEEARLAREAAARCDAELNGLGRVKDHVRDAAQFLSCLYEQPTLIGVAGRARVSDHPRGLAVDLMTRGERGDRIAECALANQEALGVSYVIWEQRVNYGDGWEGMSDRGGDTENHYDHVHVSFENGGGSGDPVAALCT